MSELDFIKEDLDSLKDNETLNILEDDGKIKYVIIPAKALEEASQLVENFNSPHTEVRVISPEGKPELTYEEYEHIKKEIIKSIDAAFKPKPEKLN